MGRKIEREPLQLTEKIVSRFWSKVKRGNPLDCWLWRAGKFPTGYGMFNVGRFPGGRQDTRYAHRVAYEIATGIHPPVGLVVMHSCDVQACCNPNHLALGTQAENVNDAARKGKYSGPRPDLWVIPAAIRADLIAQCMAGPRGTIRRLANEYGLSFKALYMAVRRARQQQKEQRACLTPTRTQDDARPITC